ncbi:hypothetical protein BDB01DRAFT_719971 [Pilobolus umbonatus]|nr:hypothetical protein BDB01DRAFT_719971 [Pilobolus umbonatus]
MSISTQLFVGLGNGHVYQFNASSFEKTVITQENINDYLAFSLHPSGPILQTFAVNLKGESQEAIKILSKPLEQHQLPEEEAKALSKESSQNSSSSEKEDQIPKPNTNTQIPLYKDTSKRMAAIGKAEYRYQDDPHLIIFVTKTTAQVMLSGYNVKLFSKEFRDEHILQSQIIFTSKGVCLCLLFNLGRIGFYSLPLLDMMLETQVPKYCSMSRLNEASISSDGRMVTWTGKYEMKQFSFVKQPDRHIGESIILYDPQRSIPLHPSLVNQQKTNKKTWLTTVAGAFQKEALTLDELDTLMGRIPTEDPTEIRKQRIEAAKNKAAESSKSSGPGGLFAELGNKMNERGERIGELDQKMQEMNAASGDFLKAVKDYNERQARKKWWEF